VIDHRQDRVKAPMGGVRGETELLNAANVDFEAAFELRE
jgi:hypothetical protein